MGEKPSILILGIGNILWADEGFGVRVLEELQRRYAFPENVTLMDGGTQGIYLAQYICEADILIVFDAVDYDLPPATLKRVEGEDVPNYLGVKKISLHQTGFQEVLAIADMMGQYPDQLLLIGVQPVELDDYGGSLRPAVRAQILPAIEMALDYLSSLGVQAIKRDVPLNPDVVRAGAIADINLYEAQRPAEMIASRKGDDRILHDQNFAIHYRPVNVDQEFVSVGLDHHLEKYR